MHRVASVCAMTALTRALTTASTATAATLQHTTAMHHSTALLLTVAYSKSSAAAASGALVAVEAIRNVQRQLRCHIDCTFLIAAAELAQVSQSVCLV